MNMFTKVTMFKTRGGYYMRYAYITKIFSFESAHHLPGHRGKCARLHGHSYRLEITLRGPIKDSLGASDHGMVTDFADLSLIVKPAVIERLDHQDLNPVPGLHTTAKHLSHSLSDNLTDNGPSEGLLYRLRPWGTQRCF